MRNLKVASDISRYLLKEIFQKSKGELDNMNRLLYNFDFSE